MHQLFQYFKTCIFKLKTRGLRQFLPQSGSDSTFCYQVSLGIFYRILLSLVVTTPHLTGVYLLSGNSSVFLRGRSITKKIKKEYFRMSRELCLSIAVPAACHLLQYCVQGEEF